MKTYTGQAWKHHISCDFDDNQEKAPYSSGAGAGGTIFFDFDFMVKYLEENGGNWHVAELECLDTPVSYDFATDKMATILVNLPSRRGFIPLEKEMEGQKYTYVIEVLARPWRSWLQKQWLKSIKKLHK